MLITCFINESHVNHLLIHIRAQSTFWIYSQYLSRRLVSSCTCCVSEYHVTPCCMYIRALWFSKACTCEAQACQKGSPVLSFTRGFFLLFFHSINYMLGANPPNPQPASREGRNCYLTRHSIIPKLNLPALKWYIAYFLLCMHMFTRAWVQCTMTYRI